MTSRRQLRLPTEHDLDRARQFAELQAAIWRAYLRIVAERGGQ